MIQRCLAAAAHVRALYRLARAAVRLPVDKLDLVARVAELALEGKVREVPSPAPRSPADAGAVGGGWPFYAIPDGWLHGDFAGGAAPSWSVINSEVGLVVGGLQADVARRLAATLNERASGAAGPGGLS